MYHDARIREGQAPTHVYTNATESVCHSDESLYVLCILVPRYIHVMAEETNQKASTTNIFAIVYIDMLNCFLVGGEGKNTSLMT
jgi:hypothetical protein